MAAIFMFVTMFIMVYTLVCMARVAVLMGICALNVPICGQPISRHAAARLASTRIRRAARLNRRAIRLSGFSWRGFGLSRSARRASLGSFLVERGEFRRSLQTHMAWRNKSRVALLATFDTDICLPVRRIENRGWVLRRLAATRKEIGLRGEIQGKSSSHGTHLSQKSIPASQGWISTDSSRARREEKSIALALEALAIHRASQARKTFLAFRTRIEALAVQEERREAVELWRQAKLDEETEAKASFSSPSRSPIRASTYTSFGYREVSIMVLRRAVVETNCQAVAA